MFFTEQAVRGGTFRENWLSDPATYPIIAVLGGAMTLVVGIWFHSLAINKDVQIDPKKRNSIIRTWGKAEYATLPSVATNITAQVTRRPTWIQKSPEGLGVDHDKWLEERKKRDEEK